MLLRSPSPTTCLKKSVLFPHDTPHEIIPSSVIFQNLPSDFGSCLLCPHRQVLPLESSIFASLYQASEGMVEYFYGLKPSSDEAFLVFGINGSNCFIHRFPEKKGDVDVCRHQCPTCGLVISRLIGTPIPWDVVKMDTCLV